MAEQVTYRHEIPQRTAVSEDFPAWLPPEIVQACHRLGVKRLWRHQRVAADSVHAGRHTAIATGTASGKSLSYLLPVLAATLAPPMTGSLATMPSKQRLAISAARGRGTAFYLAPTKALAHDQLRVCRELDVPGWRPATLDGDSDEAERAYAREHAHYILTNPDMLHASVLPQHRRWAPVLRSLRVIVVDESHRYRGVFGSHVSAVLRRLLRLCAHYGAHPSVVFASATTANPGELAANLIGVTEDQIAVVEEDDSPHGAVTFALFQPRADPDSEAAAMMAAFVAADRQSITFVPSRQRAELIAARARQRSAHPDLIESYRSGYLAQDRRELERRLADRTLMGVAATNALELGVDISGLDAVIIAGFPGTMAALWQQSGRAGRSGGDALAVLLARPDPLDAYLFEHPELIFDRPLEATVLHPSNPYVLAPHLAAAAQELPLTEADERWFGPSMHGLVEDLAEQKVLRRRSVPAGKGAQVRGWFWPHPERAVDAIDLRSSRGRSVDIVDQATGRVIGHVDRSAADRSVFPGAVYLHRGETWVVDEREPEDDVALVRADSPHYYTQPESSQDVRILQTHESRDFFAGQLHWGEVEISSQVLGYLRRDEQTHQVWDSTPLEMPVRTLQTHGMWWTLPAELEARLGWSDNKLGSAAHAAEHTAIGLLPVFAPCDRWDIGGLSTARHPDTGLCTVFVHDGHPGGAGFAEHGFKVAEPWWMATLTRLLSCECEQGCPACVISPKCGNGNQMLDKTGAAELLVQLGLHPSP